MTDKKEIFGKMARVIGGDGTKVRVGSKDELRYFSVMPCRKLEKGRTIEQIQNVEKEFYISPRAYPGYKNLVSTENGRKIVRDWEERQKDLNLQTYDIIEKTVVSTNVVQYFKE